VLFLLVGAVLSGCGSAPVAQNWPGLTVEGDTVYVISGLPQQVYMLDAENGQSRGTFIPSGEHQGVIYWSPVVLGPEAAYVGFGESQTGIMALFAFDPETGQELWSAPAKDLIIGAPVYADGTVYFGDSAGTLYAVDAENGTGTWSFQAEDAIWSPVFVHDGRVYVPSMDHYLYCLDANSGQEIWKQKLDGAMAEPPSLAAATGTLYIGNLEGRVYALDLESGEPDEGFEFQAENWIWSEILVEDELLYVTALDGRLYALSAEDGSRVGPEPFDAASPLRASPVLVGESILVASEEGRVVAVDGQTAMSRWEWPGGAPEAGVLTTPVVRDGVVFVVLLNGKVPTLDAETGTQIWTFEPPEGE
jgi:eukaryotic-like serine/threonine-protein kinase